MPSVVGLLEQHELFARRRVDGLREEADRIQAELAAAEEEWQEWAIARRRVDTVLAPDSAADAGPRAAAGPREADKQPASRDAANPRSQVPVWREEGRLFGAVGRLPAHPSSRRGPCPSRPGAADLPGNGRSVRHGRGAGAGGGIAVEGETPGRPRLAGRARTRPVHPRPRCGRARQRVMRAAIDQ